MVKSRPYSLVGNKNKFTCWQVYLLARAITMCELETTRWVSGWVGVKSTLVWGEDSVLQGSVDVVSSVDVKYLNYSRMQNRCDNS